MKSIKFLRTEIDKIDSKILELIECRFVLTDQIGIQKNNNSLLCSDRENEVIQNLLEKTNLDSVFVKTLWHHIMKYSLNRQEKNNGRISEK